MLLNILFDSFRVVINLQKVEFINVIIWIRILVSATIAVAKKKGTYNKYAIFNI